MTDPRRQPSQTLMYARVRSPQVVARVSRLAIGSLPVAIFASPCVLSQVRGLNQFVPLYVAAAAITIALPIVAPVRIGRSQGTRTGSAWAIVALAISVVIWGGLLILFLAMGSDPYWHG